MRMQLWSRVRDEAVQIALGEQGKHEKHDCAVIYVRPPWRAGFFDTRTDLLRLYSRK